MAFAAVAGAVAGPLIGGLLGGASGGSSQGGTQTVSKDPWTEAAPWLKQQIATGQQLQDYYQRNPFNSQQQNAYGNLAAGTNAMNQLVPSLLGQLSNQRGFDRTNPLQRPNPVNLTPTGQFGFGTQASGFQPDMNGAGNPFANGGIKSPAAPVAPAAPAQTWRDSQYYNPESESMAWLYDQPQFGQYFPR